MNSDLMNERIKGLIGHKLLTQEGKVLPVEKIAIRRYCESSGNLNPLYLDEEYASRERYGSIIAPPTFFSIPFRSCAGTFCPIPQGTENPHVAELMELLQLKRALDAGQETEFFAPIRLGDVLHYDKEIFNIAEKRIKVGPALLVSARTVITNQRGELVCIDVQEWFFFE
ncbi:MaoC family dehydratase N-terminal domain-containing protein [Chloroflexota bacterium]